MTLADRRFAHRPFPILAMGAVTIGSVVALVGAVLFLAPREAGGREFTAPRASLTDSGPPYCERSVHVCVVETAAGDYAALVILDTNEFFRAKGCSTLWRADFDLGSVGGPVGGKGAFRSGCSGATFDREGKRLFGPSPRDLDRFTTEVRGETVIVFLDRVVRSSGR